MSNKKNISLNAIYTLCGNFFYGFFQWALLIVIAKLETPTTVGQYSLALAFASPIYFFFSLQLSTVYVTDVKEEYDFLDFLYLRFVCLFAASFLLIIASFTLRSLEQVSLLLIPISLIKIFESIRDMIYAIWQKSESMHMMSISRVLQGTLQIVILYAILKYNGDLFLALLIVAIVSLLITIFYDVYYGLKGYKFSKSSICNSIGTRGNNFSESNLYILFKKSLPLGIVSALSMLNATIPRYFLGYHSSLEELGIFSALWSIILLISMLCISVMQSLLPKISRLFDTDLTNFVRLMRNLILLSTVANCLVVIASYLWGSSFISLIFGKEYAAYPDVFLWMMASSILYIAASIIGSFISATRSFQNQFIVWIFVVITSAAMCALLIPKYRLLGAAWAYFSGCATWLIGNQIMISMIVRSKKEQNYQLKTQGVS
ncbi:MAG TPA: oligosaccharide flippase family protein [Abditibacterium sp.]|jgi:O-antigen/teichoic acid export membrane protein